MQVCLKKNMKLYPDKLRIGRRVTFGGVTIEACKAKGDDKKRVYMSPSDEKLQAFLDLKTPESKVEVQRACGMIAQMKMFCPGVMLTFQMLQKMSSHSPVFTWNDSLETEFESINLSPLDTSKKIFCYTDASLTCGMAYLLFQMKQESDEDKDPVHVYVIINCDSTTFCRVQCHYSPLK